MSHDFNPYVILGVANTASNQDIQRNYENLIERLDPKTNANPAASQQAEQVASAYKMLMDSIERRKLDENLQKSQDTAEGSKEFSVTLMSSKRAIKPLAEEQVIYLLAEINAPPGTAKLLDQREVRLNLTIVIDQSKSMEDEGRMDKVKAAAQTIITELSSKDVISIISFNDRATTIIPATAVQNKVQLRTRLGMIQPKGGTEIYQGLLEGVKENRKFLDPQMVNHIILLTDGRTYGDEDECIELAKQIAKDGISISTMGLGSDWNDTFLDELASLTGGTSTYIKSVNMVSKFLNEQLRHLSNAFAERMQISIVPDPDIILEMAFKLSPQAQPLSHKTGVIPLASLQGKRPISVLLQLQLPANMEQKYRSLVRIVASGAIMLDDAKLQYDVSDMSLEVTDNPETESGGPPNAIVDALSKLTLYRLQEKAHEAMERGDVAEATRKLEYLATRLLDLGETELGRQAMAEAQHIMQTRAFSDETSKKTIKYQTRALIQPGGVKEALTTLFDE
jgi:Ca-activated chloride channel family protein